MKVLSIILFVVCIGYQPAEAQEFSYATFLKLKTGSSLSEVQAVFPSDTLQLVQTHAILMRGLSDFNVYLIQIPNPNMFPGKPLYAIFTFDMHQDILIAKALVHQLSYSNPISPSGN